MWSIDEYNRKFLMEDIRNVLKKTIDAEKNTNFKIKLMVKTVFKRKSPKDKEKAHDKQIKELDLSQSNDC